MHNKYAISLTLAGLLGAFSVLDAALLQKVRMTAALGKQQLIGMASKVTRKQLMVGGGIALLSGLGWKYALSKRTTPHLTDPNKLQVIQNHQEALHDNTLYDVTITLSLRNEIKQIDDTTAFKKTWESSLKSVIVEVVHKREVRDYEAMQKAAEEAKAGDQGATAKQASPKPPRDLSAIEASLTLTPFSFDLKEINLRGELRGREVREMVASLSQLEKRLQLQFAPVHLPLSMLCLNLIPQQLLQNKFTNLRLSGSGLYMSNQKIDNDPSFLSELHEELRKRAIMWQDNNGQDNTPNKDVEFTEVSIVTWKKQG